MSTEAGGGLGSDASCEYQPLILVTRGDEMPKKNYETKLHPTYEVRTWINNSIFMPI
jgi:hypothetical protein